MRLKFSSKAGADIREIAAFIAKENPVRAAHFLQELRSACRGLLDKPKRFARVFAETENPIRKRPYGAYLIFYEVGENAVSIVRVLHGARDYAAILEDRNVAPQASV